jgi:uncharacterized protein (TIGR00159 family)
MIEYLRDFLVGQYGELRAFLDATFDWRRDLLDIGLVALAIYWLLLLIKGTRAVQVLLGFGFLLIARVVADWLELQTLGWLLDTFLGPAVLILVILFQNDIRRALARVGRGFSPRLTERQESRVVEEVVRTAQELVRRRLGGLIVFERETRLDDLIEAATPLDAAVSKELLTSLFLPASPLHDGAVVIAHGRVANAGCILPLTLRTDLPEGVGTRHRAAVGMTEESDAVVIVVSEETAAISVAMGGEMTPNLDAARLRVVLRDYLSRGQSEPDEPIQAEPSGARETPGAGAAPS